MGGARLATNLFDYSKARCYEPYHDMVVNEFKELVYTAKIPNAYLTLEMLNTNYEGKGKFLVCGTFEKNGIPLTSDDFTSNTLSTYGGASGELYVRDGFFQQEREYKGNWLLHAPIKCDKGDVITLKHFQIYKL
ncbi:hypothetical protein QP246_02530 [Aerococcus urinae]|nr:hypothetical protein [Aerococcus urinae]